MSTQEPVAIVQSPKPKLLDQVRRRCRVIHLAPSTEDIYVSWIRRFILFHGKRHPLEMGNAEVTAFLTHLAVEGHVAASTQNQALSALLFLYREVLQQDFGWLKDVVRARKGKRLPVVFSPQEAVAIIEQLKGRRWLMGVLIYGGGLRLNECLRLRVKDLDFERLQPHVPPFVRHALAGRACGYPHGTRTAGSQGREDHADLHACAASEWFRGLESRGLLLVCGVAATQRGRSMVGPASLRDSPTIGGEPLNVEGAEGNGAFC
jgi:integrase